MRRVRRALSLSDVSPAAPLRWVTRTHYRMLCCVVLSLYHTKKTTTELLLAAHPGRECAWDGLGWSRMLAPFSSFLAGPLDPLFPIPIIYDASLIIRSRFGQAAMTYMA
jgi:hypothetical protein